VAFAYACQQDCYVLGIEKFHDLVEASIESIKAAHPHLLDKKIVEIRTGNILGSTSSTFGTFPTPKTPAVQSS
jgi:hypothetical protein